MKERKLNRFEGAFIGHERAMRESPAWRALTFQDRLILDRLELEHMAHGGAENGRLRVTYDQFTQAGVRRQSIPPSIRRLSTLGFLEVTEKGYRASSDFRVPSSYRLTYLPAHDGPKTHEWRRLEGEAAVAVALERAELAHTERRTPEPLIVAELPARPSA